MTNDQINTRVKHDVITKFARTKITKSNKKKITGQIKDFVFLRLAVYGVLKAHYVSVVHGTKGFDIQIEI